MTLFIVLIPSKLKSTFHNKWLHISVGAAFHFCSFFYFSSSCSVRPIGEQGTNTSGFGINVAAFSVSDKLICGLRQHEKKCSERISSRARISAWPAQTHTQTLKHIGHLIDNLVRWAESRARWNESAKL